MHRLVKMEARNAFFGIYCIFLVAVSYAAALSDTVENSSNNATIVIGSVCNSNDTCNQTMLQTFCSPEGICTCEPLFVPNINATGCLKIVQVKAGSCVEDSQCYNIGAKCVESACAAVLKLPPVAVAAVSAPATTNQTIKLGANCTHSHEICKEINNSRCQKQEGICECLETYVQNLNSTQCLPKGTNSGDACEIDKQCEHFGAQCKNSKCVKVGGSEMNDQQGATKEATGNSRSSISLVPPTNFVATMLFIAFVIIA